MWGSLPSVYALRVSEWVIFGPLVDGQLPATFVLAWVTLLRIAGLHPLTWASNPKWPL
jgi:hypothetical protein